MREAVRIREALSRSDQEGGADADGAVDVIIRNNNDNRRWLRKLYRDEYLQVEISVQQNLLFYFEI